MAEGVALLEHAGPTRQRYEQEQTPTGKPVAAHAQTKADNKMKTSTRAQTKSSSEHSSASVLSEDGLYP